MNPRNNFNLIFEIRNPSILVDLGSEVNSQLC